jgi:hypothetical protein
MRGQSSERIQLPRTSLGSHYRAHGLIGVRRASSTEDGSRLPAREPQVLGWSGVAAALLFLLAVGGGGARRVIILRRAPATHPQPGAVPLSRAGPGALRSAGPMPSEVLVLGMPRWTQQIHLSFFYFACL